MDKAGELIYHKQSNKIEGIGYNNLIDCTLSLDSTISKSKLSKKEIVITIYKDTEEYKYIGRVGEILPEYSGLGGWGKPIEATYTNSGDRYSIMDNSSKKYLCTSVWQDEICCYTLSNDFTINKREEKKIYNPPKEPKKEDKIDKKSSICSIKRNKIVCTIAIFLVIIIVAIFYLNKNSSKDNKIVPTPSQPQGETVNLVNKPVKEECTEYQKNLGLCRK